jgi:hypothetical protein
MTNFIVCCVSILALVTAAVPARSTEQAAHGKHVLPSAASPAKSAEDDCEARMRKLDASPAEGEERLREKNEVIDYCASQYKTDKTIARLLKECAKYVEQQAGSSSSSPSASWLRSTTLTPYTH